ncbi:MAG: hypothetical protein FD155_3439 [Bacteroidetes bacterium]|nr:MAG: hypothetical protein FD155_3439 [Bacteroidota bacterium]
MKLTVIIILTFGFLSCNNSADKKTVDNKTAKDSLVNIDTFYVDQNEVNSNEYKEFHQCEFDKILSDPKTPKLAKDIYLDKEWDLRNDTEALALLDSLTAKDKTSRPFYFKVVIKSEKKSDGYYSEGLGYAGYNYVLNNTKEFASYFDNKQCHTDNDLATWADIVIMEFGISGEGSYDKPIVDNYIKKLKSNCKDCSTAQKETINKFGLTLKGKWNEFLKHID